MALILTLTFPCLPAGRCVVEVCLASDKSSRTFNLVAPLDSVTSLSQKIGDDLKQHQNARRWLAFFTDDLDTTELSEEVIHHFQAAIEFLLGAPVRGHGSIREELQDQWTESLQRRPDLEIPKIHELPIIGETLRQFWDSKGWGKQIDFNLLIASRIIRTFRPEEAFLEYGNRLLQMLEGGTLEQKLAGDGILGLQFIAHLQFQRMHNLIADQGAVDVELLRLTARRFGANLITWLELHDHETLQDQDKQRFKFLMIWIYTRITDVTVYDSSLAIDPTKTLSIWPKGWKQSMTYYLLGTKYAYPSILRRFLPAFISEFILRRKEIPGIFIDLPTEDKSNQITREKAINLLAYMLAIPDSFWEEMGYASPWKLHLSLWFNAVPTGFGKAATFIVAADGLSKVPSFVINTPPIPQKTYWESQMGGLFPSSLFIATLPEIFYDSLRDFRSGRYKEYRKFLQSLLFGEVEGMEHFGAVFAGLRNRYQHYVSRFSNQPEAPLFQEKDEIPMNPRFEVNFLQSA